MYKQRPNKKHPRIPISSCNDVRIWKWVDQQARKFNVGKSFVVATALSIASGISIREMYFDIKKR